MLPRPRDRPRRSASATGVAAGRRKRRKMPPAAAEKGRKRGQLLLLSTPRPASSGDTRDGLDNRACPSPFARRSTPLSLSSPRASAPPKPTSLPTLGGVLRSASCHRHRFNSSAMMSSASALSSRCRPAGLSSGMPHPPSNRSTRNHVGRFDGASKYAGQLL